MLLRSTAGTLTTIFLLVLVLPIALGNAPVPWLVSISEVLPGRAIISMLAVDADELSTSQIVAVTSAWSSAALLAGGWSLLRRDAV